MTEENHIFARALALAIGAGLVAHELGHSWLTVIGVMLIAMGSAWIYKR